MPDTNTETAFVLPAEAVTGTDAVAFPGFPGTWVPGQPVAIGELGFSTDDEARAALSDLGLPLEEVDVKMGSAAAVPPANHAPNETEVRAGAEQHLGTADEFPPPPLTSTDGEPVLELAPDAALVGGTVEDVAVRLADADTDTLDRAEAAESADKKRAGVYDAIDARRAELDQAAADAADAGEVTG